MVFNAECPFCHIEVRQIPDERLGMSADCPRCHNSFTLAPTVAAPATRFARPTATAAVSQTVPPEPSLPEELPAPGEALEEKPWYFTEDDDPAAPEPVSEEAEEPAPTEALDVAAAETSARELDAVAHVAPPAVIDWQATPTARAERRAKQPRGDRYGAFALLGGSLALLVAQFPYVWVLTVPLSLVGAVFGILAVVQAVRRAKPWKLASAGLGVSLVALGIALLWPSLLDLPPLWGASSPEVAKRVAVVKGQDGSGAERRSIEAGEWLDASRLGVEQGDVRVQVLSAALGLVEFKDAQGKALSRERLLALRLRVSNVGVGRRFDAPGWEGGTVTVRDDKSRLLRERVPPAAAAGLERLRSASVPPGKHVEETLYFEPPPAGAAYLRLDLPGEGVGLQGPLHFEVPRSMISVR